MRIFNTGADLDAALSLPALMPGAFRFAPQFKIAGFSCCDCGAVKVFDSGLTTGYARVDGNQLCCFFCADNRQRHALTNRDNPAYGYVSTDGRRNTWPLTRPNS